MWASPAYDIFDLHAAKGPPSSRHRKVTLLSEEASEKVAPVEVVVAAGWTVIEVSGGAVSTVT
jgi:hypothetical protein